MARESMTPETDRRLDFYLDLVASSSANRTAAGAALSALRPRAFALISSRMALNFSKYHALGKRLHRH